MSMHVWRAAGALGMVVLSILGAAPAFADDNETEFSGAVQAMPASGSVGIWTIAGRSVHVDASTEIDQENGSIGVGAIVEVNGVALMDGSVQASEIEVKTGVGGSSGAPPTQDDAEFTGTIERLPVEI